MFRIFKKFYWVIGAISFLDDNPKDLENATIKFMKSFLDINKMKEKDLILVMIIAPKNLHSSYPCTFLRLNYFTFPCITLSDIEVKGTPQNILRFVIQCRCFKKPKDLYLEEAAKLKDIIDKLI